jgi:hypothetical protein
LGISAHAHQRAAAPALERRSAQFCLAAAIYERYFFGFSFESRDPSAAIRRFASRKFSGLQSSAMSTMSSAKQWH